MTTILSARKAIFAAAIFAALSGCVQSRPSAHSGAPSESFISKSSMGWSRHAKGDDWTTEALAAVAAKDALLAKTIPGDIANWCPAYAKAPLGQRRAFWVGLMSAVSKHESTWNPAASGGGGRYIGLMQISPRTAASHGCEAKSAGALKDGGDNLVCAVEIFARKVAADGVVVGNGRQGIGRDWGPFRKADKRAEMAAWTSAQPWCKAG